MHTTDLWQWFVLKNQQWFSPNVSEVKYKLDLIHHHLK